MDSCFFRRILSKEKAKKKKHQKNLLPMSHRHNFALRYKKLKNSERKFPHLKIPSVSSAKTKTASRLFMIPPAHTPTLSQLGSEQVLHTHVFICISKSVIKTITPGRLTHEPRSEKLNTQFAYLSLIQYTPHALQTQQKTH